MRQIKKIKAVIYKEAHLTDFNDIDNNSQGQRPENVILHHDNARPHTSLTTRQKLLHFDWDVLPHPLYSPDLAPFDFYLFHSLQNSLQEKSFEHTEEVNLYLSEFFNKQ
ncbi:Mariner Mos1 transposase [Anthophora plagiata]